MLQELDELKEAIGRIGTSERGEVSEGRGERSVREGSVGRIASSSCEGRNLLVSLHILCDPSLCRLVWRVCWRELDS